MTAPREPTEVRLIDESLADMQALASRTWTPRARHHPGQLAWSARFALPQDVDHGPVAIWSSDGRVVAWAWVESPGWGEICVDPAASDVRVAADGVVEWLVGQGVERVMVLETEAVTLAALAGRGFVAVEAPWFTHHLLDLADLSRADLSRADLSRADLDRADLDRADLDRVGVSDYRFRSVGPDEAAERAACHRAAWSPPGSTSKVTTAAYERLMATAPYLLALDWVAVDPHGTMVASCCVWLDAVTGVALVEPVGCLPDHRGRGLAGTVSAAALSAAREHGASTGLVCPRGDDGYPVPQRVYRRLGFRPVARTQTLRRERR